MSLVEKGITYKLFAGFLVSSELRMHLRNSSQWKEHQIVQDEMLENLKIAPFEGKDYLGYYIEPSYIKVNELEKIEEKIREALQKLLPKYSPNSLTLYLFAQAFIS